MCEILQLPKKVDGHYLKSVGGFLLIAMAAGVTWVGARSKRGSTGEKATNNVSYLHIVSGPVDPLALEFIDAQISRVQHKLQSDGGGAAHGPAITGKKTIKSLVS